jgi:hypothetical protein
MSYLSWPQIEAPKNAIVPYTLKTGYSELRFTLTQKPLHLVT